MNKNVEKIKKFPFPEIFKSAWEITWRNRYLWWFGFFIALGGGSATYLNFSGGNSNKEEFTPIENISLAEAMNFLNEYKVWIISIIVAILVFISLLIIAKVISRAGLIKSIDSISNHRENGFRKGFFQAKKYFWKILFIQIGISIFIIFSVMVLFAPPLFLLYTKAIITGAFLLLLAVLIFIPIVLLSNLLKIFSCQYIVLGDLNIKDSLENAYNLFFSNLFSSLLMLIIFWPIRMAVVLGVVLLIILSLIPFGFLGLIFYLIFKLVGVFIILGIWGLVVIVVVFLIQSVYETFFQSAWNLFFSEIAKNKKKETERVSEEIKNSIPADVAKEV